MQCANGTFEPKAPNAPIRFGTPDAQLRLFADLNGDGKADLVELSADGQFVLVTLQ